MSTRKQQAPRPARPAARYWKGKAPKGLSNVASDSDSDSDGERDVHPEQPGDIPISGEQDIAVARDEDEDDEWEGEEADIVQTRREVRVEVVAKGKAMNVSLRDVNISKDGKVIVAGREESGRTVMEVDESEHESEEDGESRPPGLAGAESDESSEGESDSASEEERRKLQFRPVFVPKRGRITINEKDNILQNTEEALKRKEQEDEERRKQSHDLVAESIKRELAEKEKDDVVVDVDDTDGLDPEGEFEAWRLRELGRIKKEKEREVLREQEREEIERRRALPEEQRLKEDLERAQKLREEKPKGQQKFLQKYWHKGAFHQDEEILKRHDFTEATESTVDASLLPKVMQVRNFGKRSRTKYTHLLDQDTTAITGGFGGTAPVKAGGKMAGDGEAPGCFLCGRPHMKKDCPQNTGPMHLNNRGGPWGSTASGANAAPSSGSRPWGAPHDSHLSRPPSSDRKPGRNNDEESSRDRGGGWRREDEKPRGARRRSRSRARSRSRSPPRRPRREDEGHRRSRSGEREGYRDGKDREKRRRLD